MAEKIVKDITKQTRDAWSDNWKNHNVEELLEIFNYPRVQRLLSILFSLLPKEGKILEGGCGLGPYLIKLRSLGYDVTGVDYDARSIDKIRSYDNTIPLYAADIEKMPFENNYFDSYLSFGVLEHFIMGPENAIQEARRVLKPGGSFIVMVPYLNILSRIKLPVEKLKQNKLLRGLLARKEKDFYHEKYFGINEIKRYLESEGFTVKEIKPIDHIFTFVSFSRIFRDKNTYDGENELAVKCADFFKKFLPWQTAASIMVVAIKSEK